MCFSCHQWFGANPADSGQWIESRRGAEKMEILRQKRNARIKVSKLEEKDIAKHYRLEHERMMALRHDGVEGELYFTSWQ